MKETYSPSYRNHQEGDSKKKTEATKKKSMPKLGDMKPGILDAVAATMAESVRQLGDEAIEAVNLLVKGPAEEPGSKVDEIVNKRVEEMAKMREQQNNHQSTNAIKR